MCNLYFDESIRENGGFIIGALVVSDVDLSHVVRERWSAMGHDPDVFEYKSSAPKLNDPNSQVHRSVIRELLHSSRLGLTVSPAVERRRLGEKCAALVLQLIGAGILSAGSHDLYIDQNIFLSNEQRSKLAASDVEVHLNQDSRTIAGLQVSDHASHALGGMLLEEMGIVRKMVRAGENSGYDPDLQLELGFELWASLRYALLGKNEHIPGLSPPPDDPANPYFRIDGYGLYISPSCSKALACHAQNIFGVNYLGCIH